MYENHRHGSLSQAFKDKVTNLLWITEADCERFVSSCPGCTVWAKANLKPHQMPKKNRCLRRKQSDVLQFLDVCHVGLIDKTDSCCSGQSRILHIKDIATGYTWLRFIPDLAGTHLALELWSYCRGHGFPREIQCDTTNQYIVNAINQLEERSGEYRPFCKAVTEKNKKYDVLVVQTLCEMLENNQNQSVESVEQDRTDGKWAFYLPDVMYRLNTATVFGSNKVVPFDLIFRHKYKDYKSGVHATEMDRIRGTDETSIDIAQNVEVAGDDAGDIIGEMMENDVLLEELTAFVDNNFPNDIIEVVKVALRTYQGKVSATKNGCALLSLCFILEFLRRPEFCSKTDVEQIIDSARAAKMLSEVRAIQNRGQDTSGATSSPRRKRKKGGRVDDSSFVNPHTAWIHILRKLEPLWDTSNQRTVVDNIITANVFREELNGSFQLGDPQVLLKEKLQHALFGSEPTDDRATELENPTHRRFALSFLYDHHQVTILRYLDDGLPKYHIIDTAPPNGRLIICPSVETLAVELLNLYKIKKRRPRNEVAAPLDENNKYVFRITVYQQPKDRSNRLLQPEMTQSIKNLYVSCTSLSLTHWLQTGKPASPKKTKKRR